MSASFDVAGFLAEPGRMAQVAAVSPGGVPLLGSVWFLYADGRFCIPSTGTIAGTAAQIAAWVSSPGH